MYFPRFLPGKAACGLCMLWVSLSASAVTQIPQPLTLNAALNWASEYNPTLRSARFRQNEVPYLPAGSADLYLLRRPAILLVGVTRRSLSAKLAPGCRQTRAAEAQSTVYRSYRSARKTGFSSTVTTTALQQFSGLRLSVQLR